MGKRELRHDVIRSLVRRHQIRTQQELTDMLREKGYECTQATVSRDIADMGLIKGPAKCYAVPEDLRLQRLMGDMVTGVRHASNQVVIHTVDGAAAGVAGAVDKASLDDVLGTVAGDDTIFVITANEEAAERFCRSIEMYTR